MFRVPRASSPFEVRQSVIGSYAVDMVDHAMGWRLGYKESGSDYAVG